MRTTLNLDDALAAEARQEAVRSGTTMTSLIEEGLRRVLDARSAQTGDRVERLLTLGREIAAALPEPWRSADHADLLYDEHGLPG